MQTMAAPHSTKRISEVADAVGVSTHTLRYYERAGLIDRVDRAVSGHRRFTDDDLTWIEFLTHLRAAGIPIRRLQAYSELRRTGDDTEERRLALMEEHRDAVIHRINELERSLALIERGIESAEDRLTTRRTAAPPDHARSRGGSSGA